jgi:hypothetical protein
MYKPNPLRPDPKKSAEKRIKESVKRVHQAYDIKKLVKILDDVFSLFIRQRNADSNGMVKCFTSGKRMHWKQAQCGHFISRRHYATRWDEINCQVQSVAENIFNQGNSPVFGQKLNEKYGPGTVEGLLLKKNNKFKLEFFTLKFLIQHYKEKLKNL